MRIVEHIFFKLILYIRLAFWFLIWLIFAFGDMIHCTEQTDRLVITLLIDAVLLY